MTARHSLLVGAVLCLTFGLEVGSPAAAHPGGLNAEGCHNNRKTGGYHCHRGAGAVPSRVSRLVSGPSGREFANCSQARAAGAAPVRAGDPGYGRHLDRDGDGVGCE
ncbi:excalibur calcium-binding domain-containing protein [Sphingomonas sp. GCM10030256]|uniref:excalibur calcium-binding domain-containing protein n=1 Tax=Sphingomonas sp. GCM10030256 TaxID=3273427 RepID=UPI00362125D9